MLKHQRSHQTKSVSKDDELKKIIIIHPEGNLNNNPNLTGLVEILCEQGYQVHYYAPAGENGPPQSPCQGAKVFLIQNGHFDLQDRYDLVIGVDRGIIPAAQIAKDLKIPCGYISYELFFADEGPVGFKQPEIEACRDVAFAVIQDEVRGKHLSIENQIPIEKMINIPVAGPGVQRHKKNFLLHDSLNIDRDKRILLYAGSINYSWSMVDQFFKNTSKWDGSWTLVLHHRYGQGSKVVEDLYRRYPAAKNIYASPFGMLPFGEMYKILNAADMGVAFYYPIYETVHDGKNLLYMGLSSGKLSTYLQHGLPVITNEIGEMSQYIRQYKSGFVIDEIDQLHLHLAQIDNAKLKRFRENSFKVFSEVLDLKVRARPLLKKIDQLVGSQAGGEIFVTTSSKIRGTEILKPADKENILISAIVSTYNSEQYIRACLEDLEAQTIADQLEIIVIDSNSPQNERAIVEEFQQRYGNIVYVRTEERETLYAAWNRGIRLAKGKYITNANTDDSHRVDALEKLVAALEAYPEADLAHAYNALTNVPNDSFTKPHAYKEVKFLPITPVTSLLYCSLGPHPVWRSSVFEKIGVFDPRYKAAGDYEFELRFVNAGLRSVLVPEILSLFYQNQTGLSFGTSTSFQEVYNIRNKYRNIIPIERCYQIDPTNPEEVAQAWTALGNFAAHHPVPWLDKGKNDFHYAYECYQRAFKNVSGYNAAYHNAILVLGLMNYWAMADKLLSEMTAPSDSLINSVKERRQFYNLKSVDVKSICESMIYINEDKSQPSFSEYLGVVDRSLSVPAPFSVIWEGSQFVNHSMALINREFCLRLAQSSQIELSVIPYEADGFDPVTDSRLALITQRLHQPLFGPAQVHIRHQWPPNFIPPAEGHWVMIQPWEFGSLPTRWIEAMRTQVDEVWAYTHYVRDCYIRSGMPADRVHVVSPGVDIERFRPETRPLPLRTQKRFKFLFVGGTIERKGIDILLDVYTQTFSASDDVCLVVKDMGGDSFYQGQTARQLIDQMQATADAPQIEYIDRYLNDAELAGLYTACDCLVHPYRGEGFALPIAEAMASGLPVIVTGHGAALDFCSDERAYLIPAEEVRMSNVKRTVNHETIDYPWWANPDRAALAGLMRHVLAHPAEARAKGQAGLAFIRDNFTWARGATAAVKRIEAVQQRPIVRFAQRPSPPETLVVLPAPDRAQLQQLGDCLRALERHQPEPMGRMAVRLVKPKEISLDLEYRLQVEEAAEEYLLSALSIALKYSQATYLVLLSHGVTVTKGWLETMIALAESDPAIAAVGPLSNIAPEQQQVSAHYPRDEKRLRKFAAKIVREHRNKWSRVSQLGSFCLLLNREAVLAAGGLAPAGSLTETLGDLYVRLQACQFKLVCARGVFVQQRADITQTGSAYGTAPLSQLGRGIGGEGKTAVSNAVTPPPDLPVRLEQAQQTGNWPEAISLLQQMMSQAQDSEAAALWNRLGYCYVKNEKPFEAEMAFARGLELAPDNLDLLANLADLYLSQSRYEQTSDYLNRALQVNPDDVPLLLSLGDCAIRLGALDTAAMAFQRVQALAPETEGIDVVLQELAAVRP